MKEEDKERRDRAFIELENLETGQLERMEAVGGEIQIPAGRYALRSQLPSGVNILTAATLEIQSVAL